MASQEDVAMTTEPAPKPATNTTATKSTQQQQRLTSRNPQWAYFKLQLIPHSHHTIKNFSIDALTARSYLISALSQFLGLMGTTIGVDILKIENPSSPLPEQKGMKIGADVPNVWIRVPRDDGAAVLAALSSWAGSLSSSSGSVGAGAGESEGVEEGSVAWRVCAKGNYLSAIVHGSGDGVFAP
ncbi:uncharacterized protein BHQ10_009677 [Talaromyces amestolkiae]|uniref:Ribonucleases P/MRP subunit Pop8-like domain-containing protein n=1 Tax=Talaromyces amestolkiae TaxID=1196081 RepID=A0A364LCW4_TALAM|nr:uncharacterized protein BHQ10_009677 [Talaromyces amestolkiae]RAO73665.1 hypothetical protein BHQ10_009677 [Talaromyces amestolkiae]